MPMKKMRDVENDVNSDGDGDECQQSESIRNCCGRVYIAFTNAAAGHRYANVFSYQ